MEHGLFSRGFFGQKGTMMVVGSSNSDMELELNRLRGEGHVLRTFTSFTHTSPGGPTDRMVAFDEIVVKFKSSLQPDQISRILSRNGLIVDRVNARDVYVLRVLDQSPNASIVIANMLYERGYTEWSEPNFAMEIHPHDDSLYIRQWYLHNVGQIANSDSGVDIKAPQAWYGGVTGDSDIIVAVLDDGIEAHDDLPSSRLVPGWTAGGGNGIPGTGDNHGEAVAGIISATHNTIGVRGVAPGVKLLSIKVFSNGTWEGYTEVADAIDSAVSRGADVLGMSWGCASSSVIEEALMDAFNNGRGGKGCILVASGGNSQVTGFPAEIDSVIAVGAVNMRNHPPWYTPADYGVDVVAPSSGCESHDCVAGEEGGLHLCERCLPDSAIVTLDRMGSAGYSTTNYTKTFGGTSAAAPQVAGVAALMLSYDPELTNHAIRFWILHTATDYGTTNWDGEGRLNARNALGAIGAPVAPWCWPDCPEEQKAGMGRVNPEISRIEIAQNYPNPFNPITHIPITIDRERMVQVTIHDLLGRTVATLHDGLMGSGQHFIQWNAAALPSGVYYYGIRSEGITSIRKLVLSK